MEEKDKLQSDFFNGIKVDSKSIDIKIQRKRFLEDIDGNVELLNKLSDDRLKILKEYYNKLINEYTERIKRLEEEE